MGIVVEFAGKKIQDLDFFQLTQDGMVSISRCSQGLTFHDSCPGEDQYVSVKPNVYLVQMNQVLSIQKDGKSSTASYSVMDKFDKIGLINLARENLKKTEVK